MLCPLFIQIKIYSENKIRITYIYYENKHLWPYFRRSISITGAHVKVEAVAAVVCKCVLVAVLVVLVVVIV